MPLSAGTKLGPYEIVSQLGAGGMGEVYRATDARLGREVAIKVLPAHLSADAELKQRFEREARAIAALDHPNICSIYDIGKQDGIEFLVLEYLDGESLAQRIARGHLHLDQLLKIATDIAEGLDKAHRAGIVHRDLKPGNIMLTKDGAKLLDFGLAKPSALSAAAGSGTAPLLSAAVTVADASPLTTRGSIVGTVQYMSPEQIEGKPADARSDIFALGAVLYEMATGKRAFEGKSQISVASSILEKEPEPLTAAQPSTPAALDYCIRTCLAKDPEQRFQTAHDVGLQLKWVATSSKAAIPAMAARPATKRRLMFATVGTIGLVLAVLATYWLTRPAQPQVLRAVIPTPDTLSLDDTGDFAGPTAISPDGSALAFVAHSKDSPRALWVRRLADVAPQKLEGTEDASFPFWSPDSRSIGFFAHGKLNKISAAGGPVVALADAPSARGGAWGKNDDILFEPDFQSPLMRVSAKGGIAATPATVMDPARHTTHRWPFFLPDGKHFLFLATNHNGGVREQNGIYMGSLDSKEMQLVLPSDSDAQYANGYLLYHSQNALVAQPFDLGSGKLSGEAAIVIDKVAHDPGIYRTVFSCSSNGTIAYQAGTAFVGSELVWMDRSGKELGHLGEVAPYRGIRISPDGKRVAVALSQPRSDVWLLDPARSGAATRLTFESAEVDNPSWSRDKSLVFYAVFPGGNSPNATTTANIYVKRTDGSGSSRLVMQEEIGASGGKARPAAMVPELLPDGKTMLYLRRSGPVGHAIFAKTLDSNSPPVQVIAPGAPQSSIVDFRPSPDGKWIAYTSNESGRLEVYIAPYPNAAAGKWQVSTSGAQFATWRDDSRELYFFSSGNTLFAVPFDGQSAQPQIGVPQTLFLIPHTAFNSFYDPAPDGKRFLINRIPGQVSSPISVLLNWPEELKKK